MIADRGLIDSKQYPPTGKFVTVQDGSTEGLLVELVGHPRQGITQARNISKAFMPEMVKLMMENIRDSYASGDPERIRAAQKDCDRLTAISGAEMADADVPKLPVSEHVKKGVEELASTPEGRERIRKAMETEREAAG